MMQLQHLYDQRDLAHDLLSRWAHDMDKLDWLDRFRISSNAIYPFACEGRLQFLRFSPETEKRAGQLEAELAWLAHLEKSGQEAVRPVPSLSGNRIERVSTPQGAYLVCVFDGIAGQRLDWMDWQPVPRQALFACGQSLAQLHGSGIRWRTDVGPRPWHWRDVLAWSVRTVEATPVLPAGALGCDEQDNPAPVFDTRPDAVRREADRLAAVFGSLPSDADVFGPIHFDFEMDNLFWQPDQQRCVPIDFDDAMCAWHALDLCKTLDSVDETLWEKAEEAGVEPHDPVWKAAAETATQCVLDGYRSVRPMPDGMLARKPDFDRFTALYGYARVVRAVAQPGEAEPEWMTGLRGHLGSLLRQRQALFLSPLP